MSREAIYVGATIVGTEDAGQYFGPIRVPGSMSRAATIASHRDKILEAREMHAVLAPVAYAGSILANDEKYDNLCHKPMLGMLASVTVLAQDGTILYQQTAKPPFVRGKVALPFLNFIKETWPKQFADSLRHGESEPQVILFGFNLKQVLRIAALEVLGRNGTAADFEKTRLPVRLWYNPAGVYDPLAVLLSSDDAKDLDINSLLRYFGIEADDIESNSQSQAGVVKALVEASQMIPMVS